MSQGPTNITEFIRKETEAAYLADMQKYNITLPGSWSENPENKNVISALYLILNLRTHTTGIL